MKTHRFLTLMLLALLTFGVYAAPACSWDHPGANPYSGNVPATVERYADIPAAARKRLRERMERRQFDDIAAITRDDIAGTHRYTELRDMHFGKGRLCRKVTRKRWSADAVERGLVYCEAEHCVIVPTVCNNVSRVTRLQVTRLLEPASSGGPQASTPVDGGSFVERMESPLVPVANPAMIESPAPSVGSDRPIIQPYIPPFVVLPPPWQWRHPPPVVAKPTPAPSVPDISEWAAMLAGLVVLVFTRRHKLH